MYPVTYFPLANPSRTKWYAIAYFFFFRVESGIHLLYKTDWLSPYKNEQPITGIPIILNLYLRPISYSQHCFIEMNSLPNVLHSTPVMLLWEPVDGRLVQVYYKTCPGAPDHLISLKVCINISDHVETFPSWRRSICWDNILYLTIVFLPIMPRESIIVYGGVC